MDDGNNNVFTASLNRKKARSKFDATTDGENAANVVMNHASTPAGAREVDADIARYKTANDNATVMFLTNALRVGKNRAEANKEAVAAIRKERAKREGHRGGGAGTGSVETLKPSVGLTDSNNCLAVYPDIGRYWRAEDNDGIGPEQVRPGSNGRLRFRCGECQALVDRVNMRVNMLTKSTLDNKRVPVCDACNPRREARFGETQNELRNLSEALGDDPDAFNALSPALQYSVMQQMGLLKGGPESMSRNIGMSIVHGDLTLKDAVMARNLGVIEGRVRDDLDDDGALANVDIDLSDSPETSTSTAAKVDQVLASTGALTLIDEETELANSIMRENNDALWEQAYINHDDLDAYVADLNSRRGTSAHADAAIDRFTRELEAVRNADLPEGYNAERVGEDGQIRNLEPSLAQRRFAAIVEDRRKYMNWSGTGAGKTLSSTLAVQGSGARETLVVCPKPVIEQWEAEFSNGFPNNTEVIIGLPDAANPLPPPGPGINRVYVTNYDKFSGDQKELQARLEPFAQRVDAIVFDEIHMAKASDEATTSRRRNTLLNFRDQAGEANPNLVVIGASATPVVNNLEEAASTLRLVEGPESAKFATKPTIKNAVAAHQRLAGAGIRHKPTYDTTLTQTDDTVDITHRVHAVQANVQALKKASKTGTVTPAMMERALLPEKLPKIVEKVKASRTPSIVYTHYTAGMVNPIRTALENEGLRVGTYTGNDSAADQKENLRKFRNGELDVLIGSKPISTGVDGLQHVSNNLVVASMPWTDADATQLTGRLNRRGQSRNVDVSYILTEAKVGNMRWSWCKDNRQKRLKFKRDMANAAVDGVLPEGTLDDKNAGVDKALSALGSLAAASARQAAKAA